MRHRALIRYLLILALCLHPLATAAEDCLPLLTAAVVKQLGANADAVFRLAARGPEVSDGIATVLRARETAGDAGLRVSAIIQLFGPGSEGVFRQLGKVKHVRRLDLFIANMAGSAQAAQGAAATLRYVTSRIDPSTITEFEFRTGMHVADVLGASGSLLEVKSLNFANVNDIVVRWEYEDILKQMTEFRDYAASHGRTVTLAFEVPIALQYRAIFDEILGELVAGPNVQFVNGF